jgi:predicted phosphate transport protein (TIGR00153 family)
MKQDFLDYLKEQDNVADSFEDAALSLTMRRTKIPEDIKKDILDLSFKVIDTVNLLPLAVKSLNELLETSFAKKGESRIDEYLNLLNEKEQLTDELELKLRRHMHEIEDEFTHGEFYHVMRTVMHIARIADHAENCGDRMRLMIAKQ